MGGIFFLLITPLSEHYCLSLNAGGKMKFKRCLFLVLGLLISMVAEAGPSSIAKIDLLWGMFEVDAGGGNLNLFPDKEGKIQYITVDVTKTIFADELIIESISLDKLMSGKVLSFPSDSAEPMIKIAARNDFTPYGGNIWIAIKGNEGFSEQIIMVSRDSSGKYMLSKNGNKIQGIVIKASGMTDESLCVDSYRIY